MSFRPNINGPLCPCGEITVAAAGTAQPLSVNWSPNYNPQTPTELDGVIRDVPEYAISFDDIIISSPPNNNGGIYLVTYNIQGATGSKNTVDSILLYIPLNSGPVSLRNLLGLSRFNPNQLAFDVDQNGDKVWAVGVV